MNEDRTKLTKHESRYFAYCPNSEFDSIEIIVSEEMPDHFRIVLEPPERYRSAKDAIAYHEWIIEQIKNISIMYADQWKAQNRKRRKERKRQLWRMRVEEEACGKAILDYSLKETNKTMDGLSRAIRNRADSASSIFFSDSKGHKHGQKYL